MEEIQWSLLKLIKNHAEKGLSLGMDLSKDETQEKGTKNIVC